MINPMPIKTIIVGTKYDLFERYDTENRKWLSRALRFIAHQNNASLYFTSARVSEVGAQLRHHLHEKLLNKRTVSSAQSDHTKPIFINNGQDSIRSMNLPSSSINNIIEILKKQLMQLFPQEEERKR